MKLSTFLTVMVLAAILIACSINEIFGRMHIIETQLGQHETEITSQSLDRLYPSLTVETGAGPVSL